LRFQENPDTPIPAAIGAIANLNSPCQNQRFIGRFAGPAAQNKIFGLQNYF
jgi:hypothetical protein